MGGRADAGPPERFSFRALERADLSLLRRWLAAEHVAAWWGEPKNIETEYFDDPDPVRRFVALRGERAVGMVQAYRWDDFPDEARGVGARPGELGMDYLIGEADMIGHGAGPEMLRTVLDVLIAEEPDAVGVRVDVAEANRRSWRCLEKLGFVRETEGVTVAGEPGPHYVYALRFGSAGKRAPVGLRRPGPMAVPFLHLFLVLFRRTIYRVCRQFVHTSRFFMLWRTIWLFDERIVRLSR